MLFAPTYRIVPHSILSFALEDDVVLQDLLLGRCNPQNHRNVETLASPLLVTKQTKLMVMHLHFGRERAEPDQSLFIYKIFTSATCGKFFDEV